MCCSGLLQAVGTRSDGPKSLVLKGAFLKPGNTPPGISCSLAPSSPAARPVKNNRPEVSALFAQGVCVRERWGGGGREGEERETENQRERLCLQHSC